ncbi:hypothetical protein SteCoe_35990 [Stentor coeruleus]|uniref:Major facilitator superfamily (MFS) profile domain-containing protein n=1 Tax=Stentor coeruleus TaxID=5963 RepID=A0A1R2AR29_9CILI|nr:hypothetical protein SteCoe_35990 [Stentor coeruleus]
MGQISKQIALYIGLLLVCSSFTLIFPFYPKIAESKGISLWLVGLIFSLNPIASVISTPLLGQYMNKIGRKRTVILSFIFSSLSMFILCPIEIFDYEIVLVLSILSRIFSGLGASFIFTSVTSIFVSDYPDKIFIMIGRMEVAIGIGFTLGPLIGAGLYFMELFGALIVLGCLVTVFIPFASKMLGTFRDLEISDKEENTLPLLLKPKIFLTLLMDMAFLFSFGLMATILEVHLYDYGFDSLDVAMVFVLESVLYLFFSMIAGSYLKNTNERLCMVIGILSLAIGYIMLAPWTVIFPNEFWVIILSIPFISFGQCFCYIFSIPYMQKCAIENYGYYKDDILDEHICSYSVTAYTIGEILGPIYAGSFIDMWNIEERCVFIAAVSVIFSIVYVLGTGMICDTFNKKSIKVQSINDLEVSITD